MNTELLKELEAIKKDFNIDAVYTFEDPKEGLHLVYQHDNKALYNILADKGLGDLMAEIEQLTLKYEMSIEFIDYGFMENPMCTQDFKDNFLTTKKHII